MKKGYTDLFEDSMVPVQNNFFPMICNEHLNMVLEHCFNITENEKNDLTKYNIYIDGKTMKLYADADRIKQYRLLKEKVKKIEPSHIAQEILYLKFETEEATGEDLCKKIEEMKETIKKSEEKNKIPKAKWNYFIFHCNEMEENFHLHRIFEY